MITDKDKPFNDISEIEDARIIIKAGGKNYSIMPKDSTDEGRSEAKQMRIAIASLILDSHFVVTPSLEEIKLKT